MGTDLDRETFKQVEAISNAVMGITGETSEDDNALQIVLGLLPVPMDNLYVQAYCTEQQRQDMLDIIADVVAYYRKMLESVDWLSDATREKAVEKLDNLRVRAVYPDELGDWSDLDFAGIETGGSLLAANAAVQAYVIAIQSDKIDTTVDKDKWDQLIMRTAMVNAFYNPQDNSINILAGILNGEVYNEVDIDPISPTGWGNAQVVNIAMKPTPVNYTVEITMAEGDEETFSEVLGFGYTS